MVNNFSAEYAERSDDELLLLASDRDSLTEEAVAALAAELSRRKLTNSEQAKHLHFVERNKQREAKRRLRKVFGSRRDRSMWGEVFWAALVMVFISSTYLALPTQYHLNRDWHEAAIDTVIASVIIAVGGNLWWRKIAFWISLLISSATHLVVVHAWTQRVGELSRGQGKLAVLLGFVLFIAVYSLSWLLRRKFYGEEAGA